MSHSAHLAADTEAAAFRKSAELLAAQRVACRVLDRVRTDDARQLLVAQWRQTMSAPDWELEDYDWRPTFEPRMREMPISRSEFCANPWNALYLSYAELVGELEQPKRVLGVLRDEERMRAYKTAIERNVKGLHVAVLESGGGVLPVLCAVAGAKTITAVERSETLARMALQTHAANVEKFEAAVLDVLTLTQTQEKKFDNPAEVVITDMFDHTFFGLRVVNSLRTMLASGLISPDVKLVPGRAVLWASLIEMRLTDVSGFDLRAMNSYRWHPSAERMDGLRQKHRELSSATRCCDIDLSAFLRKNSATSYDVNVPVTANGMWNAVAVWYELDLGNGLLLSSAECSSIRKAIFYIDEQRIPATSSVDISIVLDGGQLYVKPANNPRRPRHVMVPSWHFDMLNDDVRNMAYEQAITRAVEAHKAAQTKQVTVLDVGTGSGLLGMMAVRAGADAVVGVELSPHMCRVADETLARNGCIQRMTVLNRDARHVYAADSDGLRGGKKPDGSSPEMAQKADILVFEVFDSGLIGEGALHVLHAAQTRLLVPDATLVPAAATVFCQLIEWRLTSVQDVFVEPLNQYNWRPDYEGIEMSEMRDQWRSLSAPIRVADFNFGAQFDGPTTRYLSIPASASGTVNAVAVWFDLILDRDTVLSTSPHLPGKGPTWQQAIQFIGETAVRQGDVVSIEATNDSYSISIKASSSAKGGNQPLCDSAWMASFNKLSGLNQQLMKNIVQSPVDHRRAALAATQMAARPGDLDIDLDAAVHFFRRMYA